MVSIALKDSCVRNAIIDVVHAIKPSFRRTALPASGWICPLEVVCDFDTNPTVK